MTKLPALCGVFVLGLIYSLAFGSTPATANALGDPELGFYPDNGMLWMSDDVNTGRGGLFVGTNECTYATKYGAATFDVINAITTYSVSSRYTSGIRHTVYCVGVMENGVLNGPSGGLLEYFNGPIPNNSGPFGGSNAGSFAGNSMAWDFFLWWTDYDPGSGGLNHHMPATSAFCATYGYSAPCGTRDVMQLSRGRYADQSLAQTRNLMLHELLHPHGVQDCDDGISTSPSWWAGTQASAAGNSICGLWVGGNNPLSGWPVLDLQLIDKIYTGGAPPPPPPACQYGLILWDSGTGTMSPSFGLGAHDITWTNWNNKGEYVGHWPGCSGTVYDVPWNPNSGFGFQPVFPTTNFQWDSIPSNAVSGVPVF